MDAWLSGFADGEGCFTIESKPEGGYYPRFTIRLRVDDRPILDALQRELGGRVSVIPLSGHNQAQWYVGKKRDLARLSAYFDRHPLRAKKARDCRIWQQAVTVYCKYNCKAPELADLRLSLIQARAFVSL